MRAARSHVHRLGQPTTAPALSLAENAATNKILRKLEVGSTQDSTLSHDDNLKIFMIYIYNKNTYIYVYIYS